MSFSPDSDIPDLSGKVILVTGGSSGLGKETLLQLAKHTPRQLIMVARNHSKAAEAIEDIKTTVPGANITFVESNLSSLSSVQNTVAVLKMEVDRLDILVNNAGIGPADPQITEDGYEWQFGTNYMGPALLTRFLMPLLKRTAALPGADIWFGPKEGISFSHLKDPAHDLSSNERYSQSKLANIYFVKSLARRHPNIMCVAVHPGVVRTGFLDSVHNNKGGCGSRIGSRVASSMTAVIGVDVQTGALGQIWAATGNREEMVSGAYYTPLKKEITNKKMVNDDALAEKLWQWTEEKLQGNGS